MSVEPVDIAALKSHMDEAWARMVRRLEEDLFQSLAGPPERPTTWWQTRRARLREWWYVARAWVAERVLRVRLYDDE